jgi:hypothetical protein
MELSLTIDELLKFVPLRFRKGLAAFAPRVVIAAVVEINAVTSKSPSFLPFPKA